MENSVCVRCGFDMKGDLYEQLPSDEFDRAELRKIAYRAGNAQNCGVTRKAYQDLESAARRIELETKAFWDAHPKPHLR